MPDRRKVVIITNSMANGGAQRVAVRLANALSSKYEVLFLPFSKERNYTLSEGVRLVDWGVPEMRVSGFWGPLSTVVSKLRGYVFFSRLRLKEKPVATVSFLRKPDWLNLFALGGGRKVVSERNNPVSKGRKYFRSARLALGLADTAVFQSETVRQYFPERIRRKGVVIPNPVAISCRATGGRGKIVSVGRLHPQKNHALLIRAFSAFSRSHPGHTLHIYGEGELRPELKRLTEDLSLQDRVFLEGSSSDVHRDIRDAEMFVLSSDYEGMPNALLEAMMMGLPCITTSFPGAVEFFGGTGACMMTPTGDADALARAMSELSDDGALRSSLASRAESYAERYSYDRVIPLWEQVLQ